MAIDSQTEIIPQEPKSHPKMRYFIRYKRREFPKFCPKDTAGKGISDSSPAVANGYVYVGSYDGNLYCLNATTGDLVWNFTTGNFIDSSPAIADGYIYVGSDDNNLYCLNQTTGGFIWSYTTGDPVDSSPAVARGYVYVGSDDNKFYCLNASTGSFIWSYTTGDSVYSSPAIVGDSVYVGSTDNTFYCFTTIPNSPSTNTSIPSSNITNYSPNLFFPLIAIGIVVALVSQKQKLLRQA